MKCSFVFRVLKTSAESNKRKSKCHFKDERLHAKTRL